MIFQIISDIHLEFDSKFSVKKLFNKLNQIPNNQILYTQNEINLIIAGDLGWPTEESYKNFLQETTNYYDNVFLISGNHEYYCGKKNNLSIEEIDQLIDSIVNSINMSNNQNKLIKTNVDTLIKTNGHIHFLNNKMILHNGVYIIGSPLWTFVDDSYKKNYIYMNDYNYIKNFTVDHSNELYKQSYDFIKNSLETIKLNTYSLNESQNEKSNKNQTKCIVITHHLPSFELINKKYKNMTDINIFFASKSDDLINIPVNYWIYGHTHTKSLHEINGVKLLCNPKGYPSEHSGYSNECIIEL